MRLISSIGIHITFAHAWGPVLGMPCFGCGTVSGSCQSLVELWFRPQMEVRQVRPRTGAPAAPAHLVGLGQELVGDHLGKVTCVLAELGLREDMLPAELGIR